MHRRLLLLISLIAISWSASFAQKAKIVNEAVSPEGLIKMGLTETFNSVSTGLNVVANGTYVYLSAKNIGNSDAVTAANWTFNKRPSGSNASFQSVPGYDNWTTFVADVKGAYEVSLSMSTASGSHDTTLTIYSADFIGVGTVDGISGQGVQCMTCHSGWPKFQDIYQRWQASGHATIFRNQIETSTHYSESCMKCHTTGYSHNTESSNGGFDDRAAEMGWKWSGHSKAGYWDSLKTDFSSLVSFATIGCENCHGPGSEHLKGGNLEAIAISAEAGNCAQCHDEPWRHNKTSEFEHSGHSEAIWSSSFATANGKQDLSDCARCHEAQGFINFTKGVAYNAKTEKLSQGSHVGITCATCHDPHGNDNVASLRYVPESSDTLANGYAYTIGGTSKSCMACHKARRDSRTYAPTKVSSSHWGPHHSVQTDVFLGQNAAEFGTAYNTMNPHTLVSPNGCVDCHMQATTDTGTVTRDRVGGHSFKMHDAENNYDHTKSCVKCHGQKNSFSEFTAKQDYDGDGNREGIQDEVKGLLTKLRMALPPVGLDSISTTDIGALNDVNINKAYFNYQLIAYDGSYGMHNTAFAVAVLQRSLSTLTGVEAVDDFTPSTFTLSQNFPNPFNPSTTIQFSIPEMSEITLKVYDAIGNEVATLHEGMVNAGTYNVNWNASNMASGIYFYKISSDKFSMTKKMVLMK